MKKMLCLLLPLLLRPNQISGKGFAEDDGPFTQFLQFNSFQHKVSSVYITAMDASSPRSSPSPKRSIV